MVQAILRRYFTTEARFPSRVVSVLGFVVDKVALGEFLWACICLSLSDVILAAPHNNHDLVQKATPLV